MAALTPPNQGTPGPQDNAQGNSGDLLIHQRVGQQMPNGPPPQGLFASPTASAQSVFAPPALPPNFPGNQQAPPQQFDPQDFHPNQFAQELRFSAPDAFDPQPSSFPRPRNQQELQLQQILVAKQLQGQSVLNPLSRQQHSHLPHPNLQFTSQPEPQFSQAANFGQPVLFPSGQIPYGAPQQPTIGPTPPQKAPVESAASKLDTFARQLAWDMHTKSPTDFINSLTGQQRAIPNPPIPPKQHATTFQPILFHPRPHSASFASSSFDRTFSSRDGHRRQTSTDSMLGESSRRNGTMARNNQGNSSIRSGTMATNSLGITAPQMRTQLSGQSIEDQNVSNLLETTSANPPDAILQLPTPFTGNAEQVDGYITSHEPEETDNEYVERTKKEEAVLDAIIDELLTEMDKEVEDRGTPPAPGTAVFTSKQIRESIPFLKYTIYRGIEDFAQADAAPSLGGDEDKSVPRRMLMSHSNRQLTHVEDRAQWVRDNAEKVNRFEWFPAVPPPDADKVFLLYPNQIPLDLTDFYPGKIAIESVPSAGWPYQYLPQTISSCLWYSQIIHLRKNDDLWLPQPLLFFFNWFGDTPHGIAHTHPLEIQRATQPGREAEFTEPEARLLMQITMQRLARGLRGLPKPAWIQYQQKFNEEFNWTPKLARMMVLDLMFQIDLVYWYQLGGDALHPWTKYSRNDICVKEGKPLCPLNDGP